MLNGNKGLILAPKNSFRVPRDSECMSNVVRVEIGQQGAECGGDETRTLLRPARGDVTGVPNDAFRERVARVGLLLLLLLLVLLALLPQ